MTYRIHVVTEDCTDLLTLRRRWFTDGGPSEDFDLEFRAWWETERQHRHAVVARAGAEPVGMANGQVFRRMPAPGRPPTSWLYGANVFVVEEHRRRGVGRLLMDALVAFARERRMARVVLAPSAMSAPFYAALGFRAADDLARLDLGS